MDIPSVTQNSFPYWKVQLALLFERPRVIFGIKKIDKAALTYFYLVAWGFTMPHYNARDKVTHVRKMIDKTALEFRERCKKAGIKIGHGAFVKGVLSRMHYDHTDGLIDMWLGRELLDLYFDVPPELHNSLTSYVQAKIKRVNRDYSWHLVVKYTGEK